MDFIVKALIKGTAKVLPQIINEVTTDNYKISEVTASEHCNNFLSLENHPQCVYTKTVLLPKDIFKVCSAYFETLKCLQISETVTLDNWSVLVGIKESSLWDAVEFRIEALVKKYQDSPTNVILMFRPTAVGKIYLKRSCEKRMNEFSNIIQPNQGYQPILPK